MSQEISQVSLPNSYWSWEVDLTPYPDEYDRTAHAVVDEEAEVRT